MKTAENENNTMAQERVVKFIDSLIDEAKSAPRLFQDLAKMEKYISESYRNRSLIELIQNADDAKATKIGIFQVPNGLIFANNGRCFSIEDFESICRSGSSTKQRSGKNIGYRGIGFKSTLNISGRIRVISGEFSFLFDRIETKKVLGVDYDVPLIRIPHLSSVPCDAELSATKHNIQDLSTIFSFEELREAAFLEELEEFDKTSLLFLHNIVEIHLFINNISREISIQKAVNNGRTIISVVENSQHENWQKFTARNNECVSIAIKEDAGRFIPANIDESLIHSFTPTGVFSGAYLKINGDFSTDPSRKTIEFDEISEKSWLAAAGTIVDLLVDLFEGRVMEPGLFSVFLIKGQDIQRSKRKIMDQVRVIFTKKEIEITRGRKIGFNELRVRPEWLNLVDYHRICDQKGILLPSGVYSVNPEIDDFLVFMGVCPISLKEIIDATKHVALSPQGCAEIIVKSAGQFRYDSSDEKIAALRKAKLFPANLKVYSAEEIKADDIGIETEFLAYLNNAPDQKDLEYLFSKIGLSRPKSTVATPSKSGFPTCLEPAPCSSSDLRVPVAEPMADKAPKVFARWRTAEENTLRILESQPGVLKVKDVSKGNLGYDLEVTMQDGRRICVEVKSVTRFGEPIKLTNNEYSSAHFLKGEYCLAVYCQSEEAIRIYRNPIEVLSFEKQCERWTWICQEYKAELSSEFPKLEGS